MKIAHSLIAALCLMLFSGCTHVQLRHSTLDQAGTLTELNYKQVLDNVALFATNSASLPYFALPSSGTAAVNDAGTAGLGLGWDILGHTSESLALGGSRGLQESWNLAPVLNIDKLARMRCAYQMLFGASTGACDHCLKVLQDYYGPDMTNELLECRIPQGWFCVGCKSDVPTGACYVGQHCDTYVWVMPNGLDGLTRFTMTILDFSTGDGYKAPTKTVVRHYKNGTPELEWREETTVEPLSPSKLTTSALPFGMERMRTVPLVNGGVVVPVLPR